MQPSFQFPGIHAGSRAPGRIPCTTSSSSRISSAGGPVHSGEKARSSTRQRALLVISIIVYTANGVVWRRPFSVVHLARLDGEFSLEKDSANRYRYRAALFFRRRDCNCRPGSCSRRSHRRPGILAQVQLIAGNAVSPLPSFVLEKCRRSPAQNSAFILPGHGPGPVLLMRCSSWSVGISQQLHKLHLLRRQLCRSFIEFLVEHYSGKGTMECEMRNGRSPQCCCFCLFSCAEIPNFADRNQRYEIE